jgi:class 3 adenylate cyclase
MSEYRKPIDTPGVNLDQHLLELMERLAEHAVWVAQRTQDGWRLGPHGDDGRLEHPSLIPYEKLSEAEKQYGRNVALETLKAILALGYRIEGTGGEAAQGPASADVPLELDAFAQSLAALEWRDLLEIWRVHKREEWAHAPGRYIALGDRLIKLGEPLLAYDAVSEGLSHAPGAVHYQVRLRQLQALSLARSGATQQANQILQQLRAEQHLDEETMGMLARTHKDMAAQAADPRERNRHLNLAYEAYSEGYKLTGGYWTGINAATLSLVLGEKDRAAALATQVRAQCLKELDKVRNLSADPYWVLATLGEAALVLGDFAQAEEWYGRAAEAAAKRFGQLSSTRNNARLLAPYLDGDWQCIERHLHIPRVSVFAGHMIDQPGRVSPRFPPPLEGVVREALREKLNRFDVGFGFSSAACGADLIFLEALMERGGEAHVVLPCDRQQFLRDSVQIVPSASWEDRFLDVLARAREVVVVSGQKLSEGSVSYDYANEIMVGLAIIRAEQLGTELKPIAAWDGTPGDGGGGTASNVELWKKLGYSVDWIDLRLLLQRECPDLNGISAQARPPARAEILKSAEETPPRIVSIMFADAKGFSKLTEDQTPLFVRHFLEMVGKMAGTFRQSGHQSPLMMNTWGDGLFFIFENVTGAAEFALGLCERVRNIDWKELGLPDLGVRIGLHAGPAYPFRDPVTQRPNFFGTHISQAARIEPVTPPNQVYASQPFAALAALEHTKTFSCEYVGQTPLAKGYGTFPTYVVRRRSTSQGA